MSTYSVLKLIHVLAAIVAVGSNLTYFIWLRRARAQSAHAAFAVEGIHALETWFANPAFFILLATGILMVLEADLGFTTFWILAAILLYVAEGVLWAALLAPSIRKQLDLAKSDAAPSEYRRAAQRTTIAVAITMVPIAGILYLMVIKPTI